MKKVKIRLSDMYLVGYEALMRPKNRSPLELIEEYLSLIHI